MSTSTTLGIKVPGIAAYEFLNCNVESFSSEVVLSDDGAIPVGTRFNVTLSGLLPVAQWSEIETVVGRGSSRMEYTRFPHSATPRVFDFSATESMIGGPFARVTATQILGSGMVLVRVEIHDHRPRVRCLLYRTHGRNGMRLTLADTAPELCRVLSNATVGQELQRLVLLHQRRGKLDCRGVICSGVYSRFSPIRDMGGAGNRRSIITILPLLLLGMSLLIKTPNRTCQTVAM
jgi:hypothetical protein